METKIFSQNQIDDAVKLLAQGDLVAFPTETVYGLGAIARKRKGKLRRNANVNERV